MFLISKSFKVVLQFEIFISMDDYYCANIRYTITVIVNLLSQ
jgi:hypothetical protein